MDSQSINTDAMDPDLYKFTTVWSDKTGIQTQVIDLTLCSKNRNVPLSYISQKKRASFKLFEPTKSYFNKIDPLFSRINEWEEKSNWNYEINILILILITKLIRIYENNETISLKCLRR